MSVLIGSLRLVFSLIGWILLGVFGLRIFAPGTPETAFVFQSLQPMEPYLERLVSHLMAPAVWILGLLYPHLPGDIQNEFPLGLATHFVTAASGICLKLPGLSETAFGQNLIHGKYLPVFPGVMDWRLMVAWIFWGRVESLTVAPLERFQLWRRRSERQKKMQALEALIRQESALNPEKGRLLKQIAKNLNDDQALLSELNNMDPLTKLLQKQAFLCRLSQEMDYAKIKGESLGLIEADIDDLGSLNEMHGRVAGDDLLRSAGKIFSQVVIPHGEMMASRIEGGKFALLLTQTTPDDVHQVAESLRVQMSQICLKNFQKVRVTASFGVSIVHFEPSNGSFEWTAQDFLSKSDGQLEKAKQSGKNQVMLSILQ